MSCSSPWTSSRPCVSSLSLPPPSPTPLAHPTFFTRLALQKGTPKLYVLDCCYSPSEWAPPSPEFPPDAPAPHDCAVLRSTSPGFCGYSNSSSGVSVFLAEALEDIAPGNGVDWSELRALIAAPMESFVGGKVEPQQTTLPRHFMFAKQGSWRAAQAKIRELERRVKELEAGGAAVGPRQPALGSAVQVNVRTLGCLRCPQGVCVDAAGNIFVADSDNNKIRRITPAGELITLAGSGESGDVDGVGSTAMFCNPLGICVDATGNIIVADQLNNKIRCITPAGEVSTLAGSGAAGNADGVGSAASFNCPAGVCVDAAGNLYVADADNNKIRRITPAGVVCTLAGSGSQGAADGVGSAASFRNPIGVCVDAAGNIIVADRGNNKIRRITPAGEVSTLAGSGVAGMADGVGTAASFFCPNGVSADAAGNIYVADEDNHKIRRITPAGEVSTLAGSGAVGLADGKGGAASFFYPASVCVEAAGTILVADSYNSMIRRITPAV